eukprot:gnl/TRDRNA2_/TRDRNA2_177610_c6_seq10.p6 gnl/TRDRNA2_/TRDRNA2_177610_c6~~gnl/TRDRNA2_/TRDRNA2_177610_c6_seq10.p6  ORF type:complete len:124 (+),score=5.77 gnl/TRDRNA2_/TRDRNA2_177610_c6_seq10:8278-8649(+)
MAAIGAEANSMGGDQDSLDILASWLGAFYTCCCWSFFSLSSFSLPWALSLSHQKTQSKLEGPWRRRGEREKKIRAPPFPNSPARLTNSLLVPEKDFNVVELVSQAVKIMKKQNESPQNPPSRR